MSTIKTHSKPIAGIAVINTIMFLIMLAFAFVFDLPARGGWRFYSFMFLSYAGTTALWAFFMIVIVKRLNKPSNGGNVPTN